MAGIYDIIVNVVEKGADAAKQKIADLGAKLKDTGHEGSGFSKIMEEVTGKLHDMSGGAIPATANLGALKVALTNPIGAALALTAAMTGVGVALAFHFADKIDEMADLGEKMGYTANQAMFISNAMKDAGLSIEQLEQLSVKLAKSMAKSGDESKGAGEAFQRLGVETTDAAGQLKSQDEVMEQLVKRYGEGNLSARDMADMQLILGKNFRENIAVFKTAKDGIEEHNKAMQDGIGISQAAIKATSDNEKANRDLKAVFMTIGGIMVEIVIPAFTKLVNGFVDSYKNGGLVAKAVDLIAESTKGLVANLGFLVRGLGLVVDALMEIGGVGSNVFGGIMKILSGDWKGGTAQIMSSLDGVGAKMKEIYTGAVGLATDMMEHYFDRTKKNVSATADYANRVRDENKGNTVTSVLRGGAGGQADPAKDAKEKVDPILAFIAALEKQVMAQDHLNQVETVGKLLQDKKFDDSPKELKNRALEIAALIDTAKANSMMKDAMYENQKMLNEYVESLEDEQKQYQMGNRDYKEMLEDRKLDIKLADELQKLKKDNLWTQERENQLLEQNVKLKQGVRDATLKAKDADQSWTGGMNSALHDYEENASNTFKQSKEVATNAFKTMEDGLVNFAMTGKLNFADMAKSIIADLIRIQIRAALSGLFKMVGGAIMGAYGGSANAAGGANSSGFGTGSGYGNQDFGGYFADGGSPPVGKASIVGENGPELFVPNSAGMIIPNSALQNGGAMSIGSITINVQGGQTNDQTAGVLKKELVNTMKQIADGRIANAKRVGGLLAA